MVAVEFVLAQVHARHTHITEITRGLDDDDRIYYHSFTDGNVMGTYLHGIFDNDDFREKILNRIKAKKHLAAGAVQDYAAFKESQYDLLAAAVKQAVDMDAIMRIIENS